MIEGAVNFKIHETSMVLCTGSMFMVPRGKCPPLANAYPFVDCLSGVGNTYLIENICDRNAKLFFTQARKVVMSDEERAAKAEHEAEIQRRKSMVRSPSAARLGTTPGPDMRAQSMARKVS